jgi:hypothetical protein
MTKPPRTVAALAVAAALLLTISWTDGVIRIRFRHCETCRATVTLKLTLPFAEL